MASTDEFREAGLYDRSGDAGNGRLELLQWLDEQGFTVGEMVDALDGGGLGALAGDRRLVPGRRLANAEARAATSLSDERLAIMATAFGFIPRVDGNAPGAGEPSGELGLTESEAQALAMFAGLATIFSDEEAIGFWRVVGSALARLADAVVALFLTDIEGPYLAVASDELALAKQVLHAVELLDDFVPLLDPVLRRHILQSIERTRLTVIDEQERLQYRYAVGFIDLVGFTPLSQEMSAAELGVFIRRFEGRAHDVITEAGARLVKLIGDEVMFVAPDADSATRQAESLMTGFSTATGRDLVPRGGLAYGDVLVRGGDYYGDVVNIASRLADDAAPGQLLVTERFAEAATCLTFADAGGRRLKGFQQPVPTRSVSFGDSGP